MESETPELLPGEEPKVPDPQAVPKQVTTSAAFGGQPPLAKDRNDAGGRRQN